MKKTPGCWLWTGHLNTHGGHGQITIKGKEQWPAHRVAYLLYHGSIPKGKKILHTCDVNICVRKEHLYPGTNADNTRDMMVRGRARWDGAGKRKLTPPQHRQMLTLIQKGGTMRGLARKFGVSPATVRYWRSRGKHLMEVHDVDDNPPMRRS